MQMDVWKTSRRNKYGEGSSIGKICGARLNSNHWSILIFILRIGRLKSSAQLNGTIVPTTNSQSRSRSFSWRREWHTGPESLLSQTSAQARFSCGGGMGGPDAHRKVLNGVPTSPINYSKDCKETFNHSHQRRHYQPQACCYGCNHPLYRHSRRRTNPHDRVHRAEMEVRQVLSIREN